MRVRKCLALGGVIFIFFGYIIIYRMADYTLYPQEDGERGFKSKDVVQEAHEDKSNIAFSRMSQHKKFQMSIIGSIKTCDIFQNEPLVDIQMSDVYNEVKFDNIDGGAWKQGWKIETNPGKWNSENKLKVFVVPHSHNDPGWLKTFEDYYFSETRSILNNMLKELSADSQKKFIWAEVSFFSLWWDELSGVDQEKVRRLVQLGQLEIVTGGWVMNDEANTHYYSMLTQLTEGHQWMKANIQVKPRNGWTIDPFGVSPVMPYLLKQMGIKHLIIQRVHYSIKKHFARNKYLEFRWRQFWDGKGSHDVLTHMTPFYSYDIPHTCGPDPKICCQFDFKRLPGNGVSCPWKEPPRVINSKNVAVRALMLLDQYRKKSELFKTNVILVPLGDDFRYQHSSEWKGQFENYEKIMKYVNENPSLNAEIKFGTLADFFNSLNAQSSFDTFPTVAGDFFTYADRDDHYWSGYYTSRPFYKRMDRILICYHRAAEILFSLGWSTNILKNPDWLLAPQTGFIKMLRDARRSLGLFQHHDGVTGTARDYVMEDYAFKMMEAIKYSQHIIQQVTHYFLYPVSLPYIHYSERIYFDFDDQREHLNGMPKKEVLIFFEDQSKRLVFFNSLTHNRKEVASIHVFTPYVQVQDHKGNIISCQTSPLFSQEAVMEQSVYKVSFVVDIPALGLTTYTVSHVTPDRSFEKNTFSKVTIYNTVQRKMAAQGFENFETSSGKEFTIGNEKVSVSLSAKGLLKAITDKKSKSTTQIHLDFIKYLARHGGERSGAYLFLPDGEARTIIEEAPLIRIFEGPIFSRVEVRLRNVRHFLTLYNCPDLDNLGVEITNIVDILNENNFELGMRIKSNLKNSNEFYTDLNGLQVIKRQRLAKLPIQGNFYPVPTAIYIEDQKSRITILTGQPVGGSSLREGELEVMQDRRLQQDDNRGLGQGVMDNKVTPNVFRILVEQRLESCDNINSHSLSVNAYKASLSLLYPLIKMIHKQSFTTEMQSFFFPTTIDLPPDMHLVSVRTFDEEEVKPSSGFIFHRTVLDTCFSSSQQTSDGTLNLNSLLPNNFGSVFKKTSLSFLEEEETIDRRKDLSLCYMDFLALVLS